MTLKSDTSSVNPGGAGSRAPLDVLLVEDNPGDAVLIRQALTQAKLSLRLHVAVDGEQALHMLVDEGIQPALVILDLNIPRIPGLSLLARWQPSPVPIVVFSSSSNEAEIHRALALGAREFVHKPSDLGLFVQAVLHIIEWADTGNQAGSR